VLFRVAPVVYSPAIIPANFRPIYQLNPVAALVMAMRDIPMACVQALRYGVSSPPSWSISWYPAWLVFRGLKPRFSGHP
ncbi:MAG: hypothetical protein ABR987_25160, partial [Terracidiphilus sp.]